MRSGARSSAAEPRTWTCRIPVKPPYDLARSLAAAASFAPAARKPSLTAHFVIRVGGRGIRVEVAQPTAASLRATFAAGLDRAAVQRAVAWIVLADLDLKPFYRLAARHPVLGPLVRRFAGVKPFRPASLFDMTVLAITEQQISLAASQAIQARLTAAFGDLVDGDRAFPEPRALARASLAQLRACGLSHAKAHYVRDLARSIEKGRLDLAAIALMPDDAACAALQEVRGLGPWSAEYIMVRGMARPDRVPFDDLGVRDAVGQILGRGVRASAAQAETLLAPFKPYRGLATYYLLVAARADRARRSSTSR